MILYSIQCDVCGHHFRIPVEDVRDCRNTHCINCGKLVVVHHDNATPVPFSPLKPPDSVFLRPDEGIQEPASEATVGQGQEVTHV